MPIAKIQLPDGRIGRFEVPEGTTPDQVMEFVQSGMGGGQAQPSGNTGKLEPAMSWPEALGTGIKNIPASAASFAKGIGQAVAHPLDTAETVVRAGAGGLQNALPEGAVNAVNQFNNWLADKGIPLAQIPEGPSKDRMIADAVGQFYADRYGSLEGLKKTVATDPVGLAADASTVLTGAGSLAAKAPGMVGRVGDAAATAGRAIDPVAATMKGLGAAGRWTGEGAAQIIGGLGTRTGAESIKTAAKAGFQGGPAAEAFQANLRGNVPMEDVVSQARGALGQMRQARGAAYREGMAQIGKSEDILDFAPIDKAMGEIGGVKSFKGVDISRSTANTRGAIQSAIDEWKALPASEYHTPEGFDALKQMLGDIRDSTEFGTPSRKIADQAYNAIKGEIVKQAPDYAKVMKDYETASGQIEGIQKGLSLGEKAATDTSLRKLQSVMRNNANTNYGNRVRMAEDLQRYGAPNLMEQLAGQSLSSWTPRGLGNAVAGGLGMGGYALGGPGLAVPVLAGQSPRLMGEAAYYGGKMAAPVAAGEDMASALMGKSPISPYALRMGAYQAGRIDPMAQALGGQ